MRPDLDDARGDGARARTAADRGNESWCVECVSRLSILSSLLSLGLLAASVGTDRWTYTSETLVLTSSSSLSNWTRGSSAIAMAGSSSSVCGVVRFRAGLWRACPNITAKNSSTSLASFALSKYTRSVAGYPRPPICISIPFLQTEMTQPVWKEAVFAGALFDRMRLSVPFFVISLILVSLAVLTSVLGHVLQNVNMLLAAVTSVFAGLSLGGGLVIYVTVASEEFEFAVSQRLPPRWHEEDNLWHQYGASFYGACLSLLMQQLSALLAMSSYLRRLKPSRGQMASVVPGLGGRRGESVERRFATGKSGRSVPMSELTVKSPLKEDTALESFKTVAL